MSGSCQQTQLQRQRQQDQLRSHASSHGPYVWSGRDVGNALMWFRSSPPSPSSANDHGERGADKTNKSDNNDDEEKERTFHSTEGCDFLRLLLHARGIIMPRPRPDRSQRPGNSNKKRTKSGGGIKPKRKSHTPSVLEGCHQSEKRGVKRSRKAAAAGGNSEDGAAAPLQSIIMGYYQLFLPSATQSASAPDRSQSQSSSKAVNEPDDHNSTKFNASDIQCAEMASSKLLNDLSSIILDRRHTREIHRASLNLINQEGGNATIKSLGSPDDVMMSQVIDAYMTHPTTCARNVYASSLFDRLLDLCRQVPRTDTVTADACLDSESSNNASIHDGTNPALHRYLQKLFGLAITNVKIQEVILLLLVEPLRRLQLQNNQKEGLSEQSERLAQLQSIHEDHVQPFQKPCQNNEQKTPDMELSPLLTSTSFWSNVSAETIEKACSRPPLPALVQHILQTSSSNKPTNNADDSNLASSTMPMAAANKPTDAQTILWWTLPSPLLCTVSQMYFPIACEYIRYWIGMAVAGHEELYNTTPDTKQSENDEYGSLGDGNNDCNNFQHSIRRMKQFSSTSDRLKMLGSHILHSMEKESRDEFEMSLMEEEDENEAFRKSFAFHVIHRAVFHSVSP